MPTLNSVPVRPAFGPVVLVDAEPISESHGDPVSLSSNPVVVSNDASGVLSK